MTIEKTMLYNGTIELCFEPKKHHYTVNGKTVDGVTSVLGIIAKPALVYWAANKASEYVDRFLPVGKGLDELEKKKLVDGCKTAHRILKDDAADVGKMFHTWVSDYIQKKNPPMPKNMMLKKSVKQFLDWASSSRIQFKSSERKVYSKKYNYAGTYDFSCIIAKKNILGDIKTSNAVYSEMHLQTAAYKQALQEEFPKIKIDHTLILRCGKDGSFEVKEMNDFEKNRDAFLAALTLYRRIKEMKFLANNS